jgi:hypothetical protein
MTYDTSTEKGRMQRMYELVREYLEHHNFAAITRLIGGSPRYDLTDYRDSDNGEAPKGSEALA